MIKVGFILHIMGIAGAEVLVAETIRRLGSLIGPVILCLDDVGPLGERMRTEGIEVLSFDRRPGLDFSVAVRMGREIRARSLQVLHAHQYTPFFYAALAARFSRIRPRVIFTEHGRHYPDVVSTRRRVLNRLVFDRLADAVNAVCGFSARSLSERDGFAGDRIEVIENGIDLVRYGPSPDRSAARLKLGVDPGRRYITTIARFHPVKDHRTLLRAFVGVTQARPDVDLLLVGDGPLRSELEAFARELRVDTRVRFMGVRDDVADILRATDLFALTSVSEAASITLLEAMACEVPVVVTAVGGNPEIVRDGVDGLMAARGDAPGIATAMLELLDNPGRARALGQSAGERVRTHYGIDRTVGRYYELYAGLAGRPLAA
jgi:L-malate glycosyltransferase